MSEKSYLLRVCDQELQIALQSSGAVLIEGAKWCGKTRTASIAAKSILYMQDQDNSALTRQWPTQSLHCYSKVKHQD